MTALVPNCLKSILVSLLVAVVTVVISPTARAQGCSGDTNGDGRVDGTDLATVLGQWGNCPPSITSVSPAHGSVLGGTVITITGTGLAATSAVTIGGAACTNVVVLTPTELRATTPPGAAGQAPIAIIASSGTGLAPVPFSYVLQSVSSIVPSSGLYVGGTPITITGQYLAGTTSVTIGGVPATNVVAVNSTTVTAVTPPGSVGATAVVVAGPKGVVTAPAGFTYLSVIVPPWATMLEAAPDPAVVYDADLRARIAATNYPWRVRDNASGIEMLLVPPGIFDMGCSASIAFGCNPDENPVHQVTIANVFYMGRYEVTQAQWTARMGSNPSQFQTATAEVPAAAVPYRPVERVSWNLVQGFLSSTGLRLPSEAEWEYAYRAGTTTAFHSMPGFPDGTNDDGQLGQIGWFESNASNQTRPVGMKAANGLGFYDTAGNVWEWVSDWYAAEYYATSPSLNPAGPFSGSTRVCRGGGWAYGSSLYLRASYRSSENPDHPGSNLGFRVARNP